MLLQRLREYASQIAMPPLMYQNVPVRYVIQLDEGGCNPQIIDRADDKNKRGPLLSAPDCKRSSGIKPKLLVDNAEYVLGLQRQGSDASRVGSQHAAFVALVQDCAAVTHEPTVEAVAHFLTALDLTKLDCHDDFDPTANITFKVGDVSPIDLPGVKEYWAQVATAGDAEQVMQCLVCGEMRPIVKRLPISIKGIPGGQPSGMTLISANASAFESYGLEASLIAPTCQDCGQRFGNALNALLSQSKTHLTVSPVVYIFWTREPMEFSVAEMFSSPTPDKVRQFLGMVQRGKPRASRFDTTPFYAAALSASGARIVIRDWIETTLDEAQRNLERYFRLQQIVDGMDERRYFPLWQLVKATVRQGAKEEPIARVGQVLLHMALHGGPLPAWLLYQMIRRTRADQQVQTIQAAIIKMVLLSQSDVSWHRDTTSSDSAYMERGNDMAELDLFCKDQGYLCGRLLAELEEIQRMALGDINATIVDRYYGTASSAPATVFGRLLRGARPHLSALRKDKKGAFLRLDEQLQDILQEFDMKQFPSTLDLMEQGRFALGYYQQKASNRRAARAAKERKVSQQQSGMDVEDIGSSIDKETKETDVEDDINNV